MSVLNGESTEEKDGEYPENSIVNIPIYFETIILREAREEPAKLFLPVTGYYNEDLNEGESRRSCMSLHY